MLSNLGRIFSNNLLLNSPTSLLETSVRLMSSKFNKSPYWPAYDPLLFHHLKGVHIKKRISNPNPLGDKPMTKGVVIRTLIRRPKKPNSGNRKVALVRLSNGKEMQAFIPGEGHNLQEHSIVLVSWWPCKDVTGVKLRCQRGAKDLPHVVKKIQ